MKCITDEYVDLTGKTHRHGVKTGRTYTVYGAGVIDGEPCYVIMPFSDIREPRFIPTRYFAPPVGLLPPGLTVVIHDLPYVRSFTISGECFLDDYFFDCVTDGEPNALAKWAEFQDRVDSWMDEQEVKHTVGEE